MKVLDDRDRRDIRTGAHQDECCQFHGCESCGLALHFSHACRRIIWRVRVSEDHTGSFPRFIHDVVGLNLTLQLGADARFQVEIRLQENRHIRPFLILHDLSCAHLTPSWFILSCVLRGNDFIKRPDYLPGISLEELYETLHYALHISPRPILKTCDISTLSYVFSTHGDCNGKVHPYPAAGRRIAPC